MIDVNEQRRSAHARLGLAGPAAAVLFAGSLFGFALARNDGYAHGTKAVSELGSVGAPSALAFNALGFVLPGMLVVILAAALVGGRAVKLGRVGPLLLGLSGLAMVVAGVFPVDMADRSATASVLHFAGAMLSGVFWVLSLFWLGPALRRYDGLQALGRATPWFSIFLVGDMVWQVAYQSGVGVLPGWGQRIGFFGYFLWLSWAGLALWAQRELAVRAAGHGAALPVGGARTARVE